jgi:hypothetical protein
MFVKCTKYQYKILGIAVLWSKPMSTDTNKTPEGSLPSRYDRGALLFISVLLFCVLSIIHSGYYIFRYNHSIQIPLVYLLNDPELFPNDPFANTLPHYASLLWRIVAAISNTISLELTLFILFVIEKLLLIYAAARLSRAFAPGASLAVFGGMALLAIGITPIVGSGTIVSDYMEQTAFSIPFFMLAAVAFHQFKPYQWAIWMALGALSNIMYGAYALTYFGLVFLLDGDYRREWKPWCTGFCVFLILNLPTFFLTFSAIQRKSADMLLWFHVVEKRFPHHLFPMEWPLLAYVKLAVFAALVILTAFWQRKAFPRLSKHLILWSVAAGIWIIIAFIAAYLLKIPFLLVLHPGRATDIWYLFASIGLIAIFANLVDTQKGMTAKAVSLCALITLLIFWQPQLNIILLFILCSLTAVALIARSVLATEKKEIFAAGLIISTALLVTFYSFFQRMEIEGGVTDALMVQPSGEQMEVAQWAKENTSTDAVFFVSPDWSFFRTLSMRPVFVTIKDASAVLWDRAYVSQWVERIQALGYDITEEKPGLARMKKKAAALYDTLTDEQIKALQQRYPIHYWILVEDKDTNFPIIFRTTNYKVVRL